MCKADRFLQSLFIFKMLSNIYNLPFNLNTLFRIPLLNHQVFVCNQRVMGNLPGFTRFLKHSSLNYCWLIKLVIVYHHPQFFKFLRIFGQQHLSVKEALCCDIFYKRWNVSWSQSLKGPYHYRYQTSSNTKLLFKNFILSFLFSCSSLCHQKGTGPRASLCWASL